MKISHKKYLYIFIMAVLYIFTVKVNHSLREEEAVEAAANHSSDVVEEEHMDSYNDRKRVALTFDDGPGDSTMRLLDGLSERNVKATFFVVGEKVLQYPDTILRMKEEGHLIGNHTYSHVQLNTLSCDAAIQEVKKTGDTIEDITGEKTEYLRPPYGECAKRMRQELNMFVVLWDVDPLDWSVQNADAVVNSVLSDVEDGDIILLHDIFDTSVDAALRIADALQKENYELVTVEELMFP